MKMNRRHTDNCSKICFLLAILLLTAALVWVPAEKAFAADTTGTYTVNYSYLNVRSGPGTSYELLGKLSQGDSVTVKEVKDGWGRITYKDKTAWVAMKYLKKAEEQSTGGTAYTVNYSYLNVRSGPGTSYKLLGKLSENQKIQVTQIKGGWAQITYQKQTAWVASRYLKKAADSKSASESQTSKTASSTAKYAAGDYTVTADYLNVRSKPDASADIMGKVNEKETVHVYEVQNTRWGRIHYNGKSGWINIGYCKQAATAAESKNAASAKAKNKDVWVKEDGNWKYYNSQGEVKFTSNSMYKAWSRIKSRTSGTEFYIVVDTSACETYIFKGSADKWLPYRLLACGPGKAETPTVKGTFTVSGKGYSFGSGYTCYYYTRFYNSYLFHSITYYQGTFKPLDATLGKPVSHGCVRLSLYNAKWIYDNIPKGTKVYVY